MLFCKDMFANVICRREVNNPSSYFSGLGSRWFVTQPFGQLRAYPSLRRAGTYCISLCYYLLSVLSLSPPLSLTLDRGRWH